VPPVIVKPGLQVARQRRPRRRRISSAWAWFAPTRMTCPGRARGGGYPAGSRIRPGRAGHGNGNRCGGIQRSAI